MYPILLETEYFILPAWHFFYVLGAINTYFLAIYLSNKDDAVGFDAINTLYVIGYISSYLGARAFSIIAEPPVEESVSGFFMQLFSFGSMTFYGGFIGGALGVGGFARLKKIPIANLCDVCFPSVFLGLFFGRIGCFLNGDDYGLLAAVEGTIPFWVFDFGDGSYRYPIQLVEAYFAMVIAIGSIRYRQSILKMLGPGGLGAISVAVYAICRFFIEIYRGDNRGWVIPEILSPAQFISIILVLLVIFWVRYRSVKARQ